jgi:hypothetical protein
VNGEEALAALLDGMERENSGGSPPTVTEMSWDAVRRTVRARELVDLASGTQPSATDTGVTFSRPPGSHCPLHNRKQCRTCWTKEIG